MSVIVTTTGTLSMAWLATMQTVGRPWSCMQDLGTPHVRNKVPEIYTASLGGDIVKS